jgi:hypothetical protein
MQDLAMVQVRPGAGIPGPISHCTILGQIEESKGFWYKKA